VVAHVLEDEGEVWKRCSGFEEWLAGRLFVRVWLWLGHHCTERLRESLTVFRRLALFGIHGFLGGALVEEVVCQRIHCLAMGPPRPISSNFIVNPFGSTKALPELNTQKKPVLPPKRDGLGAENNASERLKDKIFVCCSLSQLLFDSDSCICACLRRLPQTIP